MKNKCLLSSISVLMAIAILMPSCALIPQGGSVESFLPSIREGAKLATISVLSVQGANAPIYGKQIVPIATDIAALANGNVTPTVERLQEVLAKYIKGPYSSFVTMAVSTAIILAYTSYYPKIEGNTKMALRVLAALSEGVAEGASTYTVVPQQLLRSPNHPRIQGYSARRHG